MGKKRSHSKAAKNGEAGPKAKRQRNDVSKIESSKSSVVAESSELPKRWTNKQRVLVFCSRGITYRARHLMLDLRTLLPHSKSDVKLDKKDNLSVVNEVAELRNCNACVYLEMRRKQDAYMWISMTPNGPSAKFLLENVHTMDELRLTGNHLKGSRPLISFDANFDQAPHWALLKEMLLKIFGTPYYHPKSKPFVDHVNTFSILDNRIWFRNYQIVGAAQTKSGQRELVEAGPRFVMQLIRIFSGSFGGPTLYQNPHYIQPNKVRQDLKTAKGTKYMAKKGSQQAYQERARGFDLPEDELAGVFG